MSETNTWPPAAFVNEWREKTGKEWPDDYTRCGDFLWMSVNKNEGWYRCDVKDGELVGVYPEGLPMWSVMDIIGPAQRRRILKEFQ